MTGDGVVDGSGVVVADTVECGLDALALGELVGGSVGVTVGVVVGTCVGTGVDGSAVVGAEPGVAVADALGVSATEDAD